MEDKTVYDNLELLAKLANFKGVEYEIELKDGRPFKAKNVKIAEIDLTKTYKGV